MVFLGSSGPKEDSTRPVGGCTPTAGCRRPGQPATPAPAGPLSGRGRRGRPPGFAPRWAAVAIAVAVTTLAVVQAPARAATVRALDLAALVAKAEMILVGQARERQSRWAHGGKVIVTDVAIRVREVLKGGVTPGEDVVVTRMGGTLDGVGLKVPGSAEFRLGGVSLLFLRRHPVTQDWRTVGMSQGRLPVGVRDGVQTIRPGGAGAELLEAGPDGELRPAQGAPVAAGADGADGAALPLSEFTATVRNLVLQQRAR